MTSIKIGLGLKAIYWDLIAFTFDLKDAFQATRTDGPDTIDRPPFYCRQPAAGFVERDEHGIPFCCQVNVFMQLRTN